MKPKATKILNIAAVLFVVIAGGYFVMKMRSGGKRAASFTSLTYKWGVGDTLQNSYDSKTGAYQFLDRNDQLIKENFKLRTNNVIFLHSKINEQDLLHIPDTIANSVANLKDPNVLRYEFKFVYDDTTKNIIYLTNYDKDPVIANKAQALQKIVQQVITEAEERFVSK
ncbi:hypothetical protein [Pedobacter sp. SL55]|uniref:hypothetical protein n=1 Tax=Pedobacter sp. SL55 TaxID=2995161 RepID=UPI0022718586|nr:hypothetical protein [Pedobacter sp. SL55]WAC40602.1 hypothetical protein OVA16_18855 [Pedobacter sp. SL55]